MLNPHTAVFPPFFWVSFCAASATCSHVQRFDDAISLASAWVAVPPGVRPSGGVTPASAKSFLLKKSTWAELLIGKA